ELLGQAPEPARRDLAAHLGSCADCREQMAQIEKTWQTLGEDPDVPVTAEFRDRTLALLEDEMLRQRIRTFRPRPRWTRVLAYAAGLALAALGGALAVRQGAVPAGAGAGAASASKPA